MPQINLTWQQDDQYDSFSVYRSTTPMDDYNLPEPIAENIIATTYTDNTALDAITLYYKIMAKKTILYFQLVIFKIFMFLNIEKLY